MPILIQRSLHTLALLGSALALGACAASPWERNFEPEPGIVTGPPIPTDAVVVRPAPFERVDEALRAFEQAWAESDVYWEDWPEHEKRAHTDRLIEALQLPGGTDAWTLLGASRFTSFDDPRPEGRELRAFAADIGADHAIWTSYYVGKSERVVDRPVHYPSWHVRSSRHGHETGIGSHTVWVPVTIEDDETLWMAFFLSRR